MTTRCMTILAFALVLGPLEGAAQTDDTEQAVPVRYRLALLQPGGDREDAPSQEATVQPQIQQPPDMQAVGRHKGLRRNLLASLAGSAIVVSLTTLATDSRRAHITMGMLAGAAATVPVQMQAEQPPERFVLLGLMVGSGMGMGLSEMLVSDAFIGVSFTPPQPPSAP